MANPQNPKIDADRLAMHGHAALTNPALIAAFDAIEHNYTEQMKATKWDEVDKRNHLHNCLGALADVRTALTIFVSNGKVEKIMNDKRKKAKK